MQWLVDLVIEAIGIPPVYIDRGDPRNVDFNIGDFTFDNAWHDLDLSAIVPEGAQGVAFAIRFRPDGVSDTFFMRKKGYTQDKNVLTIESVVALIPDNHFGIIGCDENRIVQYKSVPAHWGAFTIQITGWIL